MYYYTLEQANALLPRLRPLLHTIMQSWRQIGEQHDQLLEILSRVETDAGGGTLSQLTLAIFELQDASAVLNRANIELRDPAIGLIDFPARRDGKTIYLCYHYGEDCVAYWHATDEGFAGRRPVDGEDL